MTSPTGIEEGDAVDVTYPTKLTANLLDKLKQRKTETGVPVATQIRRAVERDLQKEAQQSPSATPPGDWESTLRSVYTDIFHSVPVSVDRVRRSKLQDLADELGFASVEDLLQDLAFRAIENPKNAASFLFAGIEESAIVAAQVGDHRTKTRKTPKTSKAA